MQILKDIYNLIFDSVVISRLSQEGYLFLVVLFLFFLVSVIVANLLGLVLFIFAKSANIFLEKYAHHVEK